MCGRRRKQKKLDQPWPGVRMVAVTGINGVYGAPAFSCTTGLDSPKSVLISVLGFYRYDRLAAFAICLRRSHTHSLTHCTRSLSRALTNAPHSSRFFLCRHYFLVFMRMNVNASLSASVWLCVLALPALVLGQPQGFG